MESISNLQFLGEEVMLSNLLEAHKDETELLQSKEWFPIFRCDKKGHDE